MHISVAVTSDQCAAVSPAAEQDAAFVNLLFLLPVFSKWLTFPLKPSSENFGTRTHCNVPTSAKTASTPAVGTPASIWMERCKLTGVQVYIWSFTAFLTHVGNLASLGMLTS